jgi:hypothetical protein
MWMYVFHYHLIIITLNKYVLKDVNIKDKSHYELSRSFNFVSNSIMIIDALPSPGVNPLEGSPM